MQTTLDHTDGLPGHVITGVDEEGDQDVDQEFPSQ